MMTLRLLILLVVLFLSGSCDRPTGPTEDYILPFGEGGQLKMLYDRRQRPQSVMLNGKIFVAFNGGGEEGAPARSPTKPMVVEYDPTSGIFSDVVTLGPGHSDHHYGPVIWADADRFLHVLYGCHSSPGTHLISKNPAQIGKSLDDWNVGPDIAPGISYPTVYRVSDNRTVIYYRTAGHISSWTYRFSDDNGQTWQAPRTDVIDLDSKGRFDWSSYQCTKTGEYGRFLHVVFTAYDDNRNNEPARYYNPRYDKEVSNEWKYNLYYVKIDLQTQEVTNFAGDIMVTPVDLDQADSKCKIWDTEWRGAGVPPDIELDEYGHPVFLHVLSEESTESHNYYFVRWVNGEWQQTVIAPSNHQWNSCHLRRDKHGVYHAYVVVGDDYIDTEWVGGRKSGYRFEEGSEDGVRRGGYMDKHGGGKIEEWISPDNGDTWTKWREIEPIDSVYTGWRYNNIQAVTNPDGSTVDDMLLFYGWGDPESPQAKAFLVDESYRKGDL